AHARGRSRKRIPTWFMPRTSNSAMLSSVGEQKRRYNRHDLLRGPADWRAMARRNVRGLEGGGDRVRQPLGAAAVPRRRASRRSFALWWLDGLLASSVRHLHSTVSAARQ